MHPLIRQGLNFLINFAILVVIHYLWGFEIALLAGIIMVGGTIIELKHIIIRYFNHLEKHRG